MPQVLNLKLMLWRISDVFSWKVSPKTLTGVETETEFDTCVKMYACGNCYEKYEKKGIISLTC